MYIHEYPKPAAVACYSSKGKQEIKAGGGPYDLQKKKNTFL